MARAKKARKSLKNESSSLEKRAVNALRQSEAFRKSPIATRRIETNKLSEIITKLVEPGLRVARNDDQKREMFLLTITGWNLSVLPARDLDTAMDIVMKRLNPDGNPTIHVQYRQILMGIIALKHATLPDDHRYIVSYDLTETKDQFHLEVAHVELES